MKSNLKFIRKRRQFAKEFKIQLVKEFETGKFSVKQLSKLHGIHPQVVYRWIYKFSTFNENGCRIVEKRQSSTQKVKELQQRVKELERMIGQKQIKIDFLEKLIELANDELHMDIKKNFYTPQSTGSDPIKES